MFLIHKSSIIAPDQDAMDPALADHILAESRVSTASILCSVDFCLCRSVGVNNEKLPAAAFCLENW